MENDTINESNSKTIAFFRAELAKAAPTNRQRVIEKFVLAALGSIPWIGGFLSAAASFKTEEGRIRANNLQTQWLEEHAMKLEEFEKDLKEILQRFENFGERVNERIQSPEYLFLVRQSFQTYDQAATDQKREYIKNLISNAAGTTLCSDDVVRLFINWLALYHEFYFAVIRQIYNNPGITRYDIWAEIYEGDLPRENSAEADLYRLIIRDLSTGGVIRQARDTDSYGRFLRKKNPRRTGHPTTIESAFEEIKPYVLTELGKQFVHYTMTGEVKRVDGGVK